jgi:ubiquinone/menaquinone biosynthesis C-methylase UbiE
MAHTPGFTGLRDRIVELAEPSEGQAVVDVGAGTGLLTLALAERVTSVWAVDSSRAMTECLREKARDGDLANVEVVHASAVGLPLADSVADVVVSNYCFHELRHADKQLALSEAMRVMRPGGRLVIGDMMFSLNPIASRDRRLVIGKVRAIARRGLPGAWRLLKNVARLLTGRWEHPASAAWWSDALQAAGFERVHIETCAHEGGIAVAYAPATKDVDERRVSLPHGSELSEASRGTSPPALIRARAAAMRLT